MNRKLLVAGVSAALGFAATANAAILFDRNGAGAGGVVTTEVFDWTPGNALFQNLITANLGAAVHDLYGHGTLSAFLLNGVSVGGMPANSELTYVFHVPMLATNVAGAGTPNWNLTSLAGLPGVGPSTFEIYYDDGATPGGLANTVTGAGFADGRLILQGTFLPGTFAGQNGSVNVVNNPGNPRLDSFGADNQPPILTDTVNGNIAFDIDVSFADDDFFLTNVTTFSVDMNLSSQLLAPFNQTNPADVVGGAAADALAQQFVNGPWGATGGPVGPFNVAPNYGDNRNDELCAANPNLPCDLHAQTDASSTFFVPEPGSLTLLGLGLLGLGMRGLRRRTA